MSDEYADSTIAMSLYNIICKTTGDVSNPETLIDIIREHAHPNLTKSQLRRVVRSMVRRGILTKRGNSYCPCDQQRRLVVIRDRDDCTIDAKGRIRGGWNGWKVRDQLKGTLSLLVLMPPKPKEVFK